ncbi:RAM signaling pathway, SOG2 [Kalmanozyma brasiliensis GHG001]|uniref:RAM signaling pathway, SOG2 n=1 Tax=Kalmanozyma brasiliensis (strain GHG001) TaxID=1365824 RepID=UPI00286811F6|nr:RAM signaling pathway, SOG2 [Kalmanozyma brasiliensis GHG001]EST05534.2 RAM signaling pathway, SOG2 [Kalmanozyma brasiliensis GHG001]
MGSSSSSSGGLAMSASAGMAGVGAGKSGASLSYLPYASADQPSYHDNNGAPYWNTFDSAQPTDPSYTYGGLPSAQSASFADAKSRAFDAATVPSTSSMYTSQSMQHLPPTSMEPAVVTPTSARRDPNAATSSHQRGISEAELLAFVDQQRSRRSTDERDEADRRDATDRSESLDTLDLCHKRITRVPDALTDLIKDQVVRLALGYNYLTRLPDNFANLHGLRYLNVRANNFANFPECVAKMPNLEILDLSRNRIRKLPQEPGRLLALRVLSLNANRLTELPGWVGKMKHLRILKLDNNPLEWPPPHISKMPNVAPPKPPPSSNSSSAAEREKAKRFEDRQMIVWIAKLRSWINNPANHPQSLGPSGSGLQLSALQEPIPGQHSNEGSDTASTSGTVRPELPASPSDGLMSLQVQVPESVSDRTLRPDTPRADPLSHEAPDTARIVMEELAPSDANAVASGLLPPLVPHSSSEDSTGYAAPHSIQPDPSVSRGEVDTTAKPSQHFMQSSRSPSTSSAGHSDRPTHGLPSHVASDDKDSRQHARNNSHSVAQDIAATHQVEARRSLKSKKSLPDLRKSHEAILQERREIIVDEDAERRPLQPGASNVTQSDANRSQLPTSTLASPVEVVDPTLSPSEAPANPPARKPLLQIRRGLRPILGNGALASARQTHENGMLSAAQPGASQGQGGGLRKLSLPTVGATQAAAEAAAAALAGRTGYGPTQQRFDVGHGRMASDRGEGNWPSRSASPTVNGARNTADQERNSYFRRLSTLPSSTISKAVPVPVLKFVDGTRGVLFALSQIHAAIGQFMTPVIDERISSQFHRLLDISNGSVGNLINALDRFDSLSRRGTPDPSVIRGVLVTCKDSVITFRKLVSVLQLQLRALQSSSDVRYARTLLLMLYGSMAEVSNSWTEMAPLVEAVQPYLTQTDGEISSPASSDAVSTSAATSSAPVSERATPPSARAGTLLQKSMSSTSNGSAPMLPSIAEATTPSRAGSRPYIARGPSRRRHAGSFSAQDLAQGAAMTPSNSSQQPPFNLEDLQATSAYNTPARGARDRRQGSLGNSASSAATFAQSEGSDRSAVVDGIQSTAPSTPGGNTATSSAQRTIYATPGATSTPMSSRQKRSGSNASSAVDASAVTPRSQATTPATPAAGTAKRSLHATTPSSANAPAAAAASGPTAAGSRLHMAVSDPKVTVDDHLLEMVDNITKLSARVWSMMFEHLRSAGVDAKVEGSSKVSPADDKNASTGLEGEEDSDGATKVNEVEGEQDAADSTVAAPAQDAEAVKKLRELRILAQVTDDLTSQLRSTYLRAREEEQRGSSIDSSSSPVNASAQEGVTANDLKADAVAAPSPDNISQSTVTKLFDESHEFVRAIVNTSTLIKAISVGHEFPREVRRLLGQVAQACSNLTVYLLWLSPTGVS